MPAYEIARPFTHEISSPEGECAPVWPGVTRGHRAGVGVALAPLRAAARQGGSGRAWGARRSGWRAQMRGEGRGSGLASVAVADAGSPPPPATRNFCSKALELARAGAGRCINVTAVSSHSETGSLGQRMRQSFLSQCHPSAAVIHGLCGRREMSPHDANFRTCQQRRDVYETLVKTCINVFA
jgi:hypothetical protein